MSISPSRLSDCGGASQMRALPISNLNSLESFLASGVWSRPQRPRRRRVGSWPRAPITCGCRVGIRPDLFRPNLRFQSSKVSGCCVRSTRNLRRRRLRLSCDRERPPADGELGGNRIGMAGSSQAKSDVRHLRQALAETPGRAYDNGFA